MIGDNTVLKWWGSMLRRWAPLFVLRHDDAGLHAMQLAADGYVLVSDVADCIAGSAPFAQYVMLINDRDCLFRLRSFAVDMVAAADLDEAIDLDVSEWSPFESSHHVYFVERNADQWSVSIWLWDRAVEQRLLDAVSDKIACTHILPESAWYVAQVKTQVLSFLVCNATEMPCYFLLSAGGLPLASITTNDSQIAQRFWRSLGTKRDNIQHVFTLGSGECWSPPLFERCIERCVEQGIEQKNEQQTEQRTEQKIKQHELILSRPRSALLSKASLPGVKNWLDPVSWGRPLLAVLSLCVAWGVADASMLHYQASQVNQQLIVMQKSAHALLNQRDDVERLHARLLSVQHLRQKQGQRLLLLAQLSQRIPNDIWLDIVQFKANWLDIRGQGKNVARLLVLLESLADVEKVVLLNDIRPDARTGMENVQLRLILTHPAPIHPNPSQSNPSHPNPSQSIPVQSNPSQSNPSHPNPPQSTQRQDTPTTQVTNHV